MRIFSFLLTFFIVFTSCKKENTPPNTSQPNQTNGDTSVIWTHFNEGSGDLFNRITDIEVKAFSGEVWVSSFNGASSTPASKLTEFNNQLSVTQVLDSNNSHLLKSKLTSFGFDMAGTLHFGAIYETSTSVERKIIVNNGGTYSNYNFAYNSLSDNDFEDFYFNADGLWFGIGSGGLIHFENGIFTTYDYMNSNIPAPGTVQDFITINGSDFWFSTHNKLLKKTGSDFQVAPVNVDPDAMDIDDYNTIWIASQSPTDYYTLHKYDGNTHTVIEIPIQQFINIQISDLVCDNYNNVWISTGGEFFGADGLYKYDGTNWTHFTTANSGLHSNNISKLALDSDGNLWIGSFDAGVIRLNNFGTLHL